MRNKSSLVLCQALRGVGGIILNAKGERFCNELGRPLVQGIVRVEHDHEK